MDVLTHAATEGEGISEGAEIQYGDDKGEDQVESSCLAHITAPPLTTVWSTQFLALNKS
jgi:hypothetical protein